MSLLNQDALISGSPPSSRDYGWQDSAAVVPLRTVTHADEDPARRVRLSLSSLGASSWPRMWPEERLLEGQFYDTTLEGGYLPDGYGSSDTMRNVCENAGNRDNGASSRRSLPKSAKGRMIAKYPIARGDSWFGRLATCDARWCALRGWGRQESQFNDVECCARDAEIE